MIPCSLLAVPAPRPPFRLAEPCCSVNTWKIPPFLWFWEAQREFFKRNLTKVPMKGQLTSASLPPFLSRTVVPFPGRKQRSCSTKERACGWEADCGLARLGQCPIPGFCWPEHVSLFSLSRGSMAAAGVCEESLYNPRRSEHSPYLGNWGQLMERRLSDWRAGHPLVHFMRILRPGEVRSLVHSNLAGQLWLS